MLHWAAALWCPFPWLWHSSISPLPGQDLPFSLQHIQPLEASGASGGQRLCSAEVPAARAVGRQCRSRTGEPLPLSYQTRPLFSLLEHFRLPCHVVKRFCSIAWSCHLTSCHLTMTAEVFLPNCKASNKAGRSLDYTWSNFHEVSVSPGVGR